MLNTWRGVHFEKAGKHLQMFSVVSILPWAIQTPQNLTPFIAVWVAP